MRTIKRVTLRNFQRHRERVFEFGPGVNAVTGPSDAGKSSLIRALRWVLLNEPAGDSFRTTGTKRTVVAVEFDDGTVVRRTRSRKVNRYEVGDLTLDDFGRGVPEEVCAATGIEAIELAGNRVCLSIAGQHDHALLLARPWSGASRADALDQLCGNDLAGRVVQELNRRVQLAGRDVADLGRREVELREALEEVGDVDAERAELDGAEEAMRAARTVDVRRRSLKELGERLPLAVDELRRAADDLAAIGPVPSVMKVSEEIDVLSQLRGSLRALRVAGFDLSAAVRELAELAEAPATDGVAEAIARVERLGRLGRDVAGVLADVGRAEASLEEARSCEGRAREELAELLRSEKRCPICAGEFDEEKIEEMTR